MRMDATVESLYAVCVPKHFVNTQRKRMSLRFRRREKGPKVEVIGRSQEGGGFEEREKEKLK